MRKTIRETIEKARDSVEKASYYESHIIYNSNEHQVQKLIIKMESLELMDDNPFKLNFYECIDSWHKHAKKRAEAIQDYKDFYITNADPQRLHLAPVTSRDEQTDFSIINSLPPESTVKKLEIRLHSIAVLISMFKNKYQHGDIENRKTYRELLEKYRIEYEVLYKDYIFEIMRIIVPIRIQNYQSDLIPLDKRDEFNYHLNRIDGLNTLLEMDVDAMKGFVSSAEKNIHLFH